MAFKILYIYDYITKLCMQQVDVTQNHDDENVRNIGQGEAQHRKYKRFQLGSSHAYYCNRTHPSRICLICLYVTVKFSCGNEMPWRDHGPLNWPFVARDRREVG
ncbi:hypothetical protein B7P43_G11839 [Cryptotermes secundus]|uniref:Uncharacterized protein n=1 Tax=Cryptotermes secundus TaxID=105785 RepID=A0A2J7RQ37_9NEOP|nr:hypothetical protein B7P43_G11839 [Cryptotermes secundus]